MLKNINSYFLLSILLLAFLVRIWNIELIPPALNWDEVSHGYNAYSILKTGKDEWGQVLPTIFRAYGDYKLPVYIYVTAVSEFFFGINAISIRLPSVLAGVLVVLFTYLIVEKIFKKKNLGLLAALFVAIEPWSLFLSRGAFEANLAMALILSGIYFLILGIEKKNKFLVLAIFLLGLSVWTYNSARVFVPLFIVAFTFIYRIDFIKIFKSQKHLLSIYVVVAGLFFVPMFLQLLSNDGSARYENVQLLDEGAVGKILQYRNNSKLDPFVNRILYNKGTYFAANFSANYLSHFSPEFLFISGGNNYQFNVQGTGLLYSVNAIFIFIGFLLLIRDHRKTRHGKLLILWLLFAPVASSLTREAPHTLRSIVILPLPMILTSLGVVYLTERFTKIKWIFVIYCAALILSFTDYFHNYTNDYRTDYAWSWQFGYKEAVKFAQLNYNTYEKIIITKKYGEPHEFVLFYFPWPPEQFLADETKIRFNQSNWYWTDKFDKFYFVNDWDIPKIGSRFILESGLQFDCASCLLITSPGNAPENWNKLKEIELLNGEVIFEIYEH